jgi:hypothetical protein
MEWPLIGIFALLIALLGYSAWSAQQVNIASARVQALAAGQDLPVRNALDLTELGLSLVAKIVIGTFVSGAGAVLAVRTWQYFQQRRRQQAWRPGPNANYQRQPQPKAPSELELLRLSMYNNLATNGRPTARRVSKASEDDETDEIPF